MSFGRTCFYSLSATLLFLSAQSPLVADVAPDGNICSSSVITKALNAAGTGNNNLVLLHNFFVQNFGAPLKQEAASSLINMSYQINRSRILLILRRNTEGALAVSCSRREASRGSR